MNYREAYKKLESLQKNFDSCHFGQDSDKDKEALSRDVKVMYGELSDFILQLTGNNNIEIQDHGQKSRYPNYIEASIVSCGDIRLLIRGNNELLKVLGQAKRLADDPILPQNEQSITSVTRILSRFRECCQYVSKPPSNEKDVQDIAWIMLRSQFDRVDRENVLPTFGTKSYRPDFAIPDLGLLIEVKFIGDKTNVKDIQEEIQADVPGYLQNSDKYRSILALIYDRAHKLLDSKPFIEALRSIDGIADILVIPGVG